MKLLAENLPTKLAKVDISRATGGCKSNIYCGKSLIAIAIQLKDSWSALTNEKNLHLMGE